MSLTENKRNSSRLGLVIDIKLINQDNVEHILKSRNISDTGVFLDCDDSVLFLPIGTVVTLQVCAQMGDEPPPPVKAEVCRISKEGMGLKFIL